MTSTPPTGSAPSQLPGAQPSAPRGRGGGWDKGRGKGGGGKGGKGKKSHGRGRQRQRDPQEEAEGPILRHSKPLYTYGNYDQYYAQRFDRCSTVDPRVEALLRYEGPGFFSGKAVLDMGCNSGFVTMLAATLGASRAEGVDIDLTLVSRALKQLRRLKQEGCRSLPTVTEVPVGGSHFPRSFVQTRGVLPHAAKPLLVTPGAGSQHLSPALGPLLGLGPAPARAGVGTTPPVNRPAELETQAGGPSGSSPPQLPAPEPGTSSAAPVPSTGEGGGAAPATAVDGTSASTPQAPAAAPTFPHNVEFRTENVLISDVEERRGLPYDIVLCFKLTKWVHLYWGDDSLKLLFHKCFRLLRPGGFFVLEAQEWQSYQCKKHLTPHTRQNSKLIQLRPTEFATYLVHVVGFQQPITVGTAPPLKRPLLLFRRPLDLKGGDGVEVSSALGPIGSIDSGIPSTVGSVDAEGGFQDAITEEASASEVPTCMLPPAAASTAAGSSSETQPGDPVQVGVTAPAALSQQATEAPAAACADGAEASEGEPVAKRPRTDVAGP